jgi:hypothetical protein
VDRDKHAEQSIMKILRMYASDHWDEAVVAHRIYESCGRDIYEGWAARMRDVR